MLKIMKHLHKYVAEDKSGGLLRMFAVGDLLTVERSQKSQIDVFDHPSSKERLEGLVPALADFHTYGNFLEVF